MKSLLKSVKQHSIFIIAILVLAAVIIGSKPAPVAPADTGPVFFNVYCEIGVPDKKDKKDEKKKLEKEATKKEATKKKTIKKKKKKKPGKIFVIRADKGEVGIAVQKCLETGGKVDHVEPVKKKRKKRPPTKKKK